MFNSRQSKVVAQTITFKNKKYNKKKVTQKEDDPHFNARHRKKETERVIPL